MSACERFFIGLVVSFLFVGVVGWLKWVMPRVTQYSRFVVERSLLLPSVRHVASFPYRGVKQVVHKGGMCKILGLTRVLLNVYCATFATISIIFELF